ncbi:MAG: class I SAM-dependent methyltransferase [Geodermatophilaceae bacterium]|nr:class I SAM-dependent methyltransferase [Geodermatophilaceae bacterium]
MKTDYSGVFRHNAAVAKYDEVVYAEDSYAFEINRRQRSWLRALVAAEFGAGRTTQHDFACGTGRAIESLAGAVRAAHGYDSAEPMLARAAAKGLDAQLHLIEEAGASPVPATTAPPSIVTVFRLFLNVSPAVRDRAVAFAGAILATADSGVLVIENHGNRRSLRHFARRPRRGSDAWFNELSTHEVKQCLDRQGFVLESIHGFALLPKGAYRVRWLRRIAGAIDETASRLPFLAPVSTNVVYVARRRAEATSSRSA